MYDTLTPSSHFFRGNLQLFSLRTLVQYPRNFLLLEKEVTSTTRVLKTGQVIVDLKGLLVQISITTHRLLQIEVTTKRTVFTTSRDNVYGHIANKNVCYAKITLSMAFDFETIIPRPSSLKDRPGCPIYDFAFHCSTDSIPSSLLI